MKKEVQLKLIHSIIQCNQSNGQLNFSGILIPLCDTKRRPPFRQHYNCISLQNWIFPLKFAHFSSFSVFFLKIGGSNLNGHSQELPTGCKQIRDWFDDNCETGKEGKFLRQTSSTSKIAFDNINIGSQMYFRYNPRNQVIRVINVRAPKIHFLSRKFKKF